ncbi:unnamed protein product [Dracunculus medinensis]|uniref:G_PROTEIN_RECEP_F1_2 domain-containing protein n=1 Tax=Dracunculus medinensis TaxID=318479 RepID=A0A0N4UR30_DRAME|nr:unnamed protein product [Dracunculus medinensis]
MNRSNNYGTNGTNEFVIEWNQSYDTHIQVIVWIAVTILSLETIIGNAMVIIAYKIEQSISDRWPLGWLTCETWLFLDYTLCLVSILTVLLITIDRYLSVCHTAFYIKWQTPVKTQIAISLSWIMPAFMFGFMIYGWSLFSDDSKSLINGECAAPFLSNPYVNMSMYLAYYWTTLLAMLILYKGIHQASKKLEKRGAESARRHMALIIGQRLGTQVGVSLTLSKPKGDGDKLIEEKHNNIENIAKDSGYHTIITYNTAIANAGGSNELEFCKLIPSIDEGEASSDTEGNESQSQENKNISRLEATKKLSNNLEVKNLEPILYHSEPISGIESSMEGSDHRIKNYSSAFFNDDSFSSALHLGIPKHAMECDLDLNFSDTRSLESIDNRDCLIVHNPVFSG